MKIFDSSNYFQACRILSRWDFRLQEFFSGIFFFNKSSPFGFKRGTQNAKAKPIYSCMKLKSIKIGRCMTGCLPEIGFLNF